MTRIPPYTKKPIKLHAPPNKAKGLSAPKALNSMAQSHPYNHILTSQCPHFSQLSAHPPQTHSSNPSMNTPRSY